MIKILLIIASLFMVACGEKVQTDTVQLSKEFMKALIVMDKETIAKVRHRMHRNSLSMEYALKGYPAFFKEHNITAEELKYTVQKGQTNNVECVVVQSNGTREGNANLPRVNWRLKYTTDKKNEGLFLKDLDVMYGHFNDKGCRK